MNLEQGAVVDPVRGAPVDLARGAVVHPAQGAVIDLARAADIRSLEWDIHTKSSEICTLA